MATKTTPEIRRGEIWWVDFTPSVGAEIQKVRPAAVMSLDSLGHLDLRIVIPLTTWREKFARWPWMMPVGKSALNGLANDSAANVLQVKSVSTDRFREFIGHLSADRVDELAAAISLVVGGPG